MAAKIVELRTRPRRKRAEEADRLRQALLPFEEELPERLITDLRYHVDRLDRPSRSKWTFVMLSPEQNAVVVNWLVENSSRPMVAVKLWAHCFEHLDFDTGEIHRTRHQMAESLSIDRDTVSRIMGELVKMGAISRKRVPVPGLRGPGTACYFMNPRVATHLPVSRRKAAQAEAPLLTLIENGHGNALAVEPKESK